MSVWETLDIEPSNDLRAIKRAYASKLKVTRPQDNAQAYQELREAFDLAKRLAKEYDYSADPLEGEDRAELTSDPRNAVDELLAGDDAEELELSNVIAIDEVQSELVLSTDLKQGLDSEPLIAVEVEEQANKESLEQASTEEEPSEEDKIYKQAVDMVQAIHDRLVDKGQVAAMALFQQQLEAPELFSLDLSKRYDMQVMDYLGWWCSRREDDEDLHLPLGLMRHVLNHYAWHKDGALSLKSTPALERNYESIVNDSGHGFLSKVANDELDYTPEYVAGAKRLLGDYKPKWFALVSIIGSHRNASNALLERVENLNDSSFDFELNTKTVEWWRASRGRFSFSFWMLISASITAVFGTLFVLDLSTSLPKFGPFLDSPFKQTLLFFVVWALSSLLIYGVAYAEKKTRDFLLKQYNKLSGLQQEFALLIMAIPVVIVMYLSAPFFVGPDILSGYILGAILLCIVYRRRTIDLLFSMYCVCYTFHYETSLSAIDHLNVFQIALPALFINTALYAGYVDFKAKQLGRRFVYSEITKGNRLGVEVLLGVSCVGAAFLLY